MKKYSTTGLIVLLAPLVFSFAIGQDIFVPEIPQMMRIFHTTQTMVQLSLSLFMVAVGVGQLIIGPLSDQYGRRKLALISIALYAIASILAAISPSIYFLLGTRIIQGIGACGMMVCAFAIVRDLTEGDESGEIYSLLNGAIAVSPLLAPLAGGYLDAWFGWRAPFFSLAIIGAMVYIFISKFLAETLADENKIKFDIGLFKRYGKIIRNADFLSYTFAASSALACFFTFFSISSYLLINLLHIPETHFGYYFAIIGITFFIGNLLSAYLCNKIGIFLVVLIGAIGLIVSGVWMLLWTLHSGTSILSFMLPTMLSAITGAFMMGAGPGGALKPFGEMAGTAAAVLGATEFLLASIVGTFILHWPVTSNLSYALPLIIFGSLAFIGVALNRWLNSRKV